MRTLHASIAASLVLAGHALAQPTAFTYQGELTQNGTPANGLHDMRFRLYSAATAGVQVGATVCADNVQVVNGKFTATIDLGASFTSTGQRFLEVDVRQDSAQDCTNTAGYSTLSPRTPVTAAPTATYANQATSLTPANGSGVNAVTVDNAGRVGIGTAAPTHSVHIANPSPTLALQDTDSTSDQAGYISFRDASNAERAWAGYGSPGDPDFSIVNARPAGDIVLNPFAGNVGIGTSGPLARLDVRGDVRLGTSGQYFAVSADENLRTLRGNVSTAGTSIGGTGWTSSHPVTGTYTITYTSAFAALPTVIACSGSNSTGLIGVSVANESAAGCTLYARNQSGVLTDASLRFIATGPR